MNLSFDPSVREYKKNLELVNEALNTMKSSEIEIKSIQDYIVAKQTLNKGELDKTYYDFGFDKIEILFKKRFNEELHIFQVDTAAFPKEQSPPSQLFFEF